MAISRKPEADKLPISQRINQRMENPKRRQATPTDWAIKGELFLNCSCPFFVLVLLVWALTHPLKVTVMRGWQSRLTRAIMKMKIWQE